MWGESIKLRAIITFIVLVLAVIIVSTYARHFQADENRQQFDVESLELTPQTTVIQIAKQLGVEPRVLKVPLELTSPADQQKTLTELDISPKQAKQRIQRALALVGEESSKNWMLIRLKFLSWAVFLVIVFILMRKNVITPTRRKLLLFISVVVFGVIFGADPSPMGTVKDAIVLYGRDHIIFRPRAIAFGLFLLSVILANKFICAWGCQFGTLQDLILRMNRKLNDKSNLIGKWKPPFILTNSVRILFFIALCAGAFVWSFDLVAYIDPFLTFKPTAIGHEGHFSTLAVLGASLFLAALFVASFFIYRPWCHFFCPFGLVGWVFEKISLYKIKVNYDTCIACQACAKACPSTVMEAILKRERVIPDCFACGTCQDICPTKSISFEKGKRQLPPPDKFLAKETE